VEVQGAARAKGRVRVRGSTCLAMAMSCVGDVVGGWMSCTPSREERPGRRMKAESLSLGLRWE
jgi:hypothetical protein